MIYLLIIKLTKKKKKKEITNSIHQFNMIKIDFFYYFEHSERYYSIQLQFTILVY